MCRMYRLRPQEEAPLCLLCCYRGGWPSCPRSKDPALTEKAAALFMAQS
jgi:hypothetical protein